MVYFAFSRLEMRGGKKNMKNCIAVLLTILVPLAVCGQSLAGYVADYNVSSPELSDGSEWTFPIVFENAGFVKVHLDSLQLGEGESIELAGWGAGPDKAYEIKGPYHGKAWLPSVDGEAAVLTLSSKGTAGFSVDKVGVGFDSRGEAGSVERICGTDDRLDPACYDASKRAAGDKVGRILFEANGTLHYCTGFLVWSDGLFATNQHCIYNSDVAESAEVRWKDEVSTCGGSVETFDTVSTGAVLVMADTGTDLALLKFSADNPASRYGYLTLDKRELEKGEIIWIPQHPAGGPKKFAVHSDSDGGATIIIKSLTGVSAGQAIGYNLDVDAGSSGSPVLDENNKAVAMHTYTALADPCTSPDLNKGIKMEILYPLIQPYISACSGTPPEITKVKYVSSKQRFRIRGTGFADDSVILVNGVVQSTRFKDETKIVAAMFEKILHGDTVALKVFNPTTGCSSGEVFYTRP
jgi:V8-like Glu-specific endopeptidase